MTNITNQLKWIATAILIVGTLLTSINVYPYGPITLLLANVVWLIVAIRWKESSLIVSNSVLIVVAVVGLLYKTGIM